MKVLPTLHLADLWRDPRMKLPTLVDYAKVPRILAGTLPVPHPVCYQITADAGDPYELQSAGPWVVIDTEYNWRVSNEKHLLTVGIWWPTGAVQIHLNGMALQKRDRVASAIRALVRRVPVVMQNALADITALRDLHIDLQDFKKIDDSMLAHACLWSELPHDLGFLGSMYGQHERTKHLSESNPELYNLGDVCDTGSAWLALRDELAADPPSKAIYENQSLPLIPILYKREIRGILVDTAKVEAAVATYEREKNEAIRLAQASCGSAFKLGSSVDVARYLYQERGMPVQKNRMTKKPTTGSDAIAALRRMIEPYPREDEDENPLGVSEAMMRIVAGADPILETRTLYSRAQQVISHFLDPLLNGGPRIYPNMKIHAQASGRWSITDPPLAQYPEELESLFIPDPGTAWVKYDWDAAELRILAALADDEPTLEAFAKGWDLHSQNTQSIFWGSTQEARLAEAKKMLSVFARNAGLPVGSNEALVLRLVPEFAAGVDRELERSGLSSKSEEEWRSRVRAPSGSESWPGRGCAPSRWEQAQQFEDQSRKNDTPRAYATALAAWIAVGGPPLGWQGKSDIRRNFAKRFVYRLNYGGDPRTAGDIPGAKELGLSEADLTRASHRFLAAHPALAAWRRRIADEVGRSPRPFSRTFMGRRRRLLGSDKGWVREAYNHPMQGAVSDILNLTTIAIAKRADWLTLVYTIHDAAIWEAPAGRIDEAQRIISEEAMRTWRIGDHNIVLPIKVKVRHG